MSEASPMRPGRILYIQKPVSSAAGIVTTIVNMPQELSLRALTTTIATPASVAMTMNSVARVVVTPATGPMQVAGDLRQRQAVLPHRGQQHDEIVHAAGQAGPDHDPAEAGKIAPLRRQHRPDQRPGAGDGRKMDAEQHQPPRGVIIDVVAEPMGGRGTPVVQHGHLGRQKRPVEPIGDQKCRQGGDHQPE